MKNTVKLSYKEFRQRLINFNKTLPSYLKNIDTNFESNTKHACENHYLKGRIAKFAQ